MPLCKDFCIGHESGSPDGNVRQILDNLTDFEGEAADAMQYYIYDVSLEYLEMNFSISLIYSCFLI